MHDRLTSHHLEILRRSLACGGLPADQVGWVLDEAARLLDERDRARALLAELVHPLADVRTGLNRLHALVSAGHPPGERPRIPPRNDPPETR